MTAEEVIEYAEKHKDDFDSFCREDLCKGSLINEDFTIVVAGYTDFNNTTYNHCCIIKDNEDNLFLVPGWYDSWGGDGFEIENIRKVELKQKTIEVYE